ncbi:hypothetical protein [Archangium sp.]|uniref:hypothetical protein n=1 Tax=Archangium sp. TaxID=1872627 RepID=UPI00286D3059|nr:hypothetical protein [Archangium sp.]
MLAEYQADPPSYQDGSKVFPFAQDVYGSPEVKQCLSEAQHRKCAYCEVRIISEAGDVEHFRPKASVRQGKGESKQRPGYFWLAYTWSNLLYACSRCNREHKRDLFPLEDPTVRADAVRDGGSTAGEAPLLLDPSTEDPERSIGFNEERAEPLGGQRRGQVTIDMLGLNRMQLLEARREKLEQVRRMVEGLRLVRAGRIPMDNPDAHKYLQKLCRGIVAAAEAHAPFAGMIRGAARQWLAPDLSFPCSEEELTTWALSRVQEPR